MRILHTGDWHLGKNLEGFSRIDEQKLFIEELNNICVNENIDVLIVAGDIYDNSNPSAEAERLFYSAVKKLADGGNRAVIIIAGNHDSPSRLTSGRPLAEEFGIIMIGTPKTIVNTGVYNGFSVTDSFLGGFVLEKNQEKAVILTMPYPTEKNINEIISEELEECKFKKSYSDKIGELFSENKYRFGDDTINIIIGHFYITGGESTDSERNIQLGGSYAVDGSVFPEKTQYAAMGHLHRPQRINSSIKHSYYAGSPIQYSKSETNYSKCVFIADLKPNIEPDVKKCYLKNYKPVEIWKAENIEEAIKKCEEETDRNCWVFFEIKTDRVLLQSEIRQLHSLKKDIVEIQTFFNEEKEKYFYEMEEKTLREQFIEFYKSSKSVEPSDELTEMFLKIADEVCGGDEIETDNS